MPPEQKPGKSEQIVCTPNDFILRLQEKFGLIEFDAAANKDNSIAADQFFGPGSSIAEDALNVSWPTDKLIFVNPPFGMIKGKNGFAYKVNYESIYRGCKILMLVPAAVGSNWFKDFIYKQGRVHFLNPRLTFKSHTQVYPKDLMLIEFNNSIPPDMFVWEWNK